MKTLALKKAIQPLIKYNSIIIAKEQVFMIK